MILYIFIVFCFVGIYSVIFNFINAEVKVLNLEILICGHGTSPLWNNNRMLIKSKSISSLPQWKTIKTEGTIKYLLKKINWGNKNQKTEKIE